MQGHHIGQRYADSHYSTNKQPLSRWVSEGLREDLSIFIRHRHIDSASISTHLSLEANVPGSASKSAAYSSLAYAHHTGDAS